MKLKKNIDLQRLHRENYDRLLKVAYRKTGCMEDAADLVQDVFVLALSNYKKFSEYDAPEAWLFVTLNFLIANYRRQQTLHGTEPLDLNFADAGATTRGLEELLPASLPPSDRELLILRFEKELDYRNIADKLGISEPACRARVSRALARCRKLLK